MLSRNIDDGAKNKTPANWLAEIEQAVVIGRATAHEHVLKHRFGDARSAPITADEVGPPALAVARAPDRHVVSQKS
jgi:hypothetical protein